MPEKGPRQIAFDLGHSEARSRDDLLVTAANREAVEAVDRWPDWPSPFLVIAGPSGAGKTHLASVWAAASGAQWFPPAGVRLPEEGLRTPFVVDDADAGALDETGLFHLINAARQAGMQGLFTARQRPAAWTVRLPDLASRLRLASVAELGEPDDALLSAVIAKQFSDRQVEIDPTVIQFLTRRIERSLAAAARIVAELDRAAMEAKSPVTRPLAAAVLSRMGEGSGE